MYRRVPVIREFEHSHVSECVIFSSGIDECEVNNGGCAELCVDTYDGYCCMCRAGHQLVPVNLLAVNCIGMPHFLKTFLFSLYYQFVVFCQQSNPRESTVCQLFSVENITCYENIDAGYVCVCHLSDGTSVPINGTQCSGNLRHFGRFFNVYVW